MGRGKKNFTCLESQTTRNLSKSHLGAVIFGCKNHTLSECLKKKIFGLPASHYSYVKNINPGLILFLFNYSDRILHGIFKAVSCGQMNIDDQAWASCEGADYTPYAAQVLMDFQTKCEPLLEDEFKPIIEKNYYSGKLFWNELDKEQTRGLIQLFLSKPLPEKIPRPPKTQNMPLPPKATKQINLSNSVADVAEPDDELENLVLQKLKKSEVPYASVLVATHAKKKWSDLFGASSSSHQETKEPTARDWSVDVEIDSLQETSRPPFRDWPADFEHDLHVFDNWEERAVEEDGGSQKAYVNEEPHELDSEGLGLTGMTLSSSENVSSPEREDSGPKTLDSEIRCDLTDWATQGNPNISECGIIKMTQEIESLKFNQLKQRLKIDSLEQELVQSKLDIEQLKKRCHVLEASSSSASNHSNVEKCDKSVETVLIVGGSDGHKWLKDLSLYSPLKEDVVSLCPMTYRRSFPSVAKLNDELYIIGGFDDGVWYDTVESYNPIINEWILRPSLNKKKGRMASACLYDTIFVMGGANGVEPFCEVELFDLNMGSWLYTQSMLEKRLGAAAACINGAIYVAGGFDGNEYLSSVERFDPRQHAWARVASMNSKRGSHSLVALNEKLYALGGYDGDSVVSTPEVFDPRLGSWMLKEPMTVPRVNFGSFVLKGKIYAIGGQDDARVLDLIECYEEAYGWRVIGGTNLGKRSCFSALVI